MLNWIACELHTHTKNSDGSFTVEELCQAAKEYDIQLIALTDHNTAAGCAKLTKELESKTVPAIKAIEWTTFFGHMVVLGANKYVDWRFATVENIDEKLHEVKAAGGLAGVAHPFRVGSPICTGCHWDYQVHEWDLVDYLEVWSELNPSIVPSNHRAIKMWTDLLDKGYQIAATYGKDWHCKDGSGRPDAATYLGIGQEEKISPEAALKAIKSGHTFVSMAPTIDFSAKVDECEYCPGDTMNPAKCEITANIGMLSRKEIWGKHSVTIDKLQFIGNGGKIVEEIKITEQSGGSYHTIVDTNHLTWLRAEIFGTMNGTACTLAITSPIYVKK